MALGLDDKKYTLDDSGNPPSGQGCRTGVPPPMPLISRDVPAFGPDENAQGKPPAANDSDYTSQWESYELPTWLAYDLSAVDAAARTSIVAVVYNNRISAYDHALNGDANVYAGFAAYRLEGSRAAGGSLPADTAWEPLAKVEGNTRHSRQHVLDFTGFNWIRIVVTALDGIDDPPRVSLDLDVHDAHAGRCDDWIFFGDGVTEQGLMVDGGDTLAARIGAAFPGRFPLMECGGIRDWSAERARKEIPTAGFLTDFPGHYVGLAFGWEDARADADPESFYTFEKNLAETVLAQGKVPVVPKIPWGPQEPQQSAAKAMNEQVDRLYAELPAVVRGPDLWSLFEQHPDYLTGDWGVVTMQGRAEVRRVWTETLTTTVYAPH